MVNMKPCPKCGTKIPTNIKGCWNCGEILDTHLIELAESVRGKK